MSEDEKKPVRSEDGAIVVENRVFRIAGRVLAYGVLVFYLVIILNGKVTGDEPVINTFDKTLMALSGLAVFAIELLRYYAKKKLG